MPRIDRNFLRPRAIFQHRLIVADCPLEAGVIGRDFLEAHGSVNPHTAICFTPAVQGLLGDTQLLDHLGYSLTSSLKDFNCPKFGADRCGCVSFVRHYPVPRLVENTNLKPGPAFSGWVSMDGAHRPVAPTRASRRYSPGSGRSGKHCLYFMFEHENELALLSSNIKRVAGDSG